MTWNRREKILASAAGGLLVAIAAWFLIFGGDRRSTAQLRKEYDTLTAELATKEATLAVAERERKQLTQWQRQSLPTDQVIARSLYQNWLRSLAKRLNFNQLNVDSQPAETRRGAYTRITFPLHARASLGDVAQFLYEFYSAGHLHLIRQMDLKPIENSGDLDVNLAIEALSLPGADRKDQLTAEAGRGLRLAKLEDYRDPIVKRNLFKPYTEIPSPKTEMDLAQFAIVTGITEVDGVRQVWLQDRTAGKLWRLAEGEEFQVGPLRGTVRTIGDDQDVTLDFDGRRRRLHRGENLRGGTELSEAPKADGKEPQPAPGVTPAAAPGSAPAKTAGEGTRPEPRLAPASAQGSAPAKADDRELRPEPRRAEADRQDGKNVPPG